MLHCSSELCAMKAASCVMMGKSAAKRRALYPVDNKPGESRRLPQFKIVGSSLGELGLAMEQSHWLSGAPVAAAS